MSESRFDMRELTELIDMIRDEQITVEQVARLEEILAEHEDARRYYRRAMRLHGYLEQNAASIQLANEAGQLARTPWGRPLAGPVKLARRRKWARWGAAAAALAVCLVLGAWLVRLAIWGGDQRQEDQAQRLVDPSEHPSIALSRAWKIKQTGNADFSIVEETVVRLDRGELWIASVDGESASTLRVQTPAGDVTASGTQFLVGFHHVPIQSEGEGPMKSLARVFVLSGIVTLTNAHGTATGGENELLATTGQSAPTKQVVQANSAFAIDMYRQLAKENAGKNLSFSPYSISIALTMTAEGARGTTAQEMGQVLCWPEAMRRAGSDAQTIPWATSTVHSGLSSLSQMLNRQQDTREKEKAPYELSIANALWGERTYPFNSEFVNTVTDAYDTGVLRMVDFKSNFQQQRLIINQWVADQTNLRIKDLLPENSVSTFTRLVLANAVYFKGDWKTPFDEKWTEEEDFTLTDGGTVKVPIMRNYSMPSVRYGAFTAEGALFDTPKTIRRGEPPVAQYPDENGFAVVELPYEGDELGMVVIAPNRPDGLKELEQLLDSRGLDRWISQLDKRKVAVYLPRFKAETDYDLVETLSALGMGSAFNPRADFSGMTSTGSRDLYISGVFHKAFVDVNEEGTEAAAATAVGTFGGGRPDSWPFIPSLHADRPFLYLIRDVRSGTILFLGRVLEP